MKTRSWLHMYIPSKHVNECLKRFPPDDLVTVSDVIHVGVTLQSVIFFTSIYNDKKSVERQVYKHVGCIWHSSERNTTHVKCPICCSFSLMQYAVPRWSQQCESYASWVGFIEIEHIHWYTLPYSGLNLMRQGGSARFPEFRKLQCC